MSRRSLITACVLHIIALGITATAHAEATSKTIPLATLQTMVSGLGLEDTGDKKTFAQVENQGKNQISVVFYPFDDDKELNIQTNLGEIPPEKMNAIPAVRMLEYSGSHLYHFSIKSDGDKRFLYLELPLEASDVTPATLRKNIDFLVETADDTEALWRFDGWKAPKKGRL